MFKLHKPGQNQCDDRATVLIVSLGLLTALTLMAITFVTLQRIEGLAARNFSERSRVEQINKGIVNYSINWLRFGTPGGTPLDTFTDEFPRNHVPPPLPSNNLLLLGAANSVYSASPEIYSWRRFMNVATSELQSFYDFIHVDLLPVDAGVSNRVVSRVRILDCSGQIFIGRDDSAGGPPANLQRVLYALMIYANNDILYNDTPDDDTYLFDVPNSYDAAADTDAKRIFDNMPYQNKSAIENVLKPVGSGATASRRSKLLQIQDYLTVHSVVDTLFRQDGVDTDGDNVLDDVYDARTANMDFQEAPRSLVNINTASQAVLVALLDPVMILPTTPDQLAERNLATWIRRARPFGRWQDFVDFIRSDSSNFFTNSAHITTTDPIDLDSQMSSFYGNQNSNTDSTGTAVNDWKEEREIILERFMPNLTPAITATSPMPRVGREGDGYDNDNDGLVDEIGERNGVNDDDDLTTDEASGRNGQDDDGDGIIDEEDEIDAEIYLEDMKTAEFTLVSAGIFEFVITSKIYLNDGKNVDDLDNNDDDTIDEDSESRLISAYGSRTIARVFSVWRESTQREFSRGSITQHNFSGTDVNTIEHYPDDSAVAVTQGETVTANYSASAGWLALKALNLAAPSSQGFYVPFESSWNADPVNPDAIGRNVVDLHTNPATTDCMQGTTATRPNVDDLTTREVDLQNPNIPGNFRVDGLNVARDATGAYSLAYNTDSFGSNANRRSKVTLAMWMKLPFKPRADDASTPAVNEATGTHYIFYMPFENLGSYATDNFDNDGDLAYTGTEFKDDQDREEYLQYVSFAVLNDKLWFNISAAVDESTMAQFDPGTDNVDGRSDPPSPPPFTGNPDPKIHKDGFDNNNDGTPDEDGELRIYSPEFSRTFPPHVELDIRAWEPNEWHYVAITWDLEAGEMKVYADGVSGTELRDEATDPTDPNKPPGGWEVPGFSTSLPFDHFYFGAPPDDVILPDGDGFPGHSNVYVDEIRMKFNSFDNPFAIDPGENRYYSESTAATFTSGAFPPPDDSNATNRNIADGVPPLFLVTRLIPYGTQLGALGWTEYMPDETTTTADVTVDVQLDNNQQVTTATFSSSFTSASIGASGFAGSLGDGAQIRDSSGNTLVATHPGSGLPNGVRIRYRLTIKPGELTDFPPLGVPAGDILTKTPVVQDVTITLLTPVQIISSVELATDEE